MTSRIVGDTSYTLTYDAGGRRVGITEDTEDCSQCPQRFSANSAIQAPGLL